MSDPVPGPEEARPPTQARRIRWDALAAIIASLVGLLALLVAGYTAYVQRQQVRAQVWPYLTAAYQDDKHMLTIFNKGVGPAIVKSVQVTVDGKPQLDWKHVFAALHVSAAENGYGFSTLSAAVLSPGDKLTLLVFKDNSTYAHFRQAMGTHGLVNICYCSTLGECWAFEDHHAPVKPVVRSVAQCPRLTPAKAFRD
ncbi:MAG TPA: hypothetical protein VF269_00100 [Rhodanobacteraceae bacterium]